MVDSRAKGVRGERKVVEVLTEWWGKIEPEAQFARTPGSGGWATPQLRAGFRASGDICTTSQFFPFAVEVKHREAWTLNRLIVGGKSPVWKWWKQTVKSAGEMQSIPMLWFSKARAPWFVMLPDVYGRAAFGHSEIDIGWGGELPVAGHIHPVVVMADRLLETHPARLHATARAQLGAGLSLF